MLKTVYKLLFGSLIIVFILGLIGFDQLFKFEPSNLPKIYFYKYPSIPFKKKATAFMSYISNTPKIDHIYFQKIRAKARGGSSEDFPKHNFTIELGNKHQLAGLKKEDDWILGASFIDKSFIRHKLSFDLFKSFSSEHKAPECEFIEVYKNFKYRGLYVLMERMDSRRLEINKKDNAACIFKEPPVFYDPKIKISSNPYIKGDVYHQKFPDLTVDNKSQELIKLREFIAYAPDTLFNREITSYFNLNDIIDWHILLLVTNNNDAILKGFYLYKKERKTQFKLALWDFNHSFGRGNNNKLLAPGIVHWERNILLSRLVKSNTHGYKNRLRERFFELVEAEILTEKNLVSMIDENQLRIKDYAKKNEKRWPVDAKPFFDDADFEDEIQLIKKWIPVQLKEVRKYVNSL